MATKPELKRIPGFSQGVRVNAAARMVKLAQPICPNSKLEMETTPEGRIVPKRSTNPHRQNCQLQGFGWWTYCEEQEHDPYFSTRVWYSKEPEYGPDPDNPDQTILLKEKTVRHETKYPNVAQVAAHTRVNGGRGVKFKMDQHGFKRLRDVGYEEVCQFRNCQKPVTVKSRVGLYCDREHAVLIGADIQNIMLLQISGRFEAGMEMEAQQKRQRGLIESGQFIDVQPLN
jgi:hypothetical protein